MEWVKLASNYYRKRRVVTLPNDAAELMFLRGMAYCGDAETSGEIPHEALPGLGRRIHKQSAAALVAAGLWEETAGGWHVVDWHEWQHELELLVEKKRRDRDRKRVERAGTASLVHGQSTDSPPNVPAQSRGEKKQPPQPPASGGRGSACQTHKARRKDWCPDCARPAPIRPDSTPIDALCGHGRHGLSCPFCVEEAS